MAALLTPSSQKLSAEDSSCDTGLFVSNTPVGFAAGDTNLYRYVSNSPTSRTDPSGLAPTFGGLAGELQAISNSEAAKAEAVRVAAAIQNTWSKNWTLYAPWAETRWGYWCYEWAYAFERAGKWETRSGKYFTVDLWSASTDDGRVHAWIKITSKETAKSIYVDDGFFHAGTFVHPQPPNGGAYKNRHPGVDVPREECSPPPAYDSRGNRIPAPSPPPGSPEPGLQSPGAFDPFGFPWIF